MKKTTLVTICLGLLFCFAAVSFAQFTGPSISGRESTVAQISNTRVGSYVILTGHIIAHQRDEYFTFRDKTGTIRVEIENRLWQNREISPETRVRLMGEVDRGLSGRYIWVKSLDVINE
jgi:uncharacterized protein (TIGR00156 family)